MTEKDLTFEKKLWKAADKLRKKVEVHEYKYIVLSLLFLRYLTYAFEEKKKELEKQSSNELFKTYLSDDKDYYLSSGVLLVPEIAHWDYIREHANDADIPKKLDDAISKLEEEYPSLKDVIPKEFTKTNLDPSDYSYLINVFTDIDFGKEHDGKDIFGRVYEYFLGKFTEAEGKKGGEFYTPRCLTKLIIEILDVKRGRIFDPACGSGGFFVSAIEKLKRENINIGELSIYGQESKEFVLKMCKMNLIIRGAEGDIRLGDSYLNDQFSNEKFNFIVSNPPFNDSAWGADKVKERNDPRFSYGIPPDNNGNYAWIQHYIYHLSPDGKAGFVMANGALSVGGIEGEIRRKIIEDDLIYGIIATPPKLFYTVSLPASLWFIRKSKPDHMKGKVLFIYAKNMYHPISRRQVTFTEEHIQKIVEKFRMFENGEPEEKINEAGFAKVATSEEIAKNGYVLTPGRYVGIKVDDEEDETFEEKIKAYSAELSKLFEEEKRLNENIREVFKSLGWPI